MKSQSLIVKALTAGTGTSSKRIIALVITASLCTCLLINVFTPGVLNLNPVLIENLTWICIAAMGGSVADKFAQVKNPGNTNTSKTIVHEESETTT